MAYHAAKPKAAKVTGRGNRRLYEPAQGPEPEWVAEARALRKCQWSYQRIADHLDKPYRQVYVALNRERVRKTNSASEKRHRPEITARQLAYRQQFAPDCESCGNPLSKQPTTQPAICRTCRIAHGQKRRRVIAALWLMDYTGSEIAEVLGLEDPKRAGVNIVHTIVSQLRADGWDLPWRRPPGSGMGPLQAIRDAHSEGTERDANTY